jgi:hypothetical protein
MWELVKAGGWLMLSLVLCSIFTVAISLERFIEDIENTQMGLLDLSQIEFSEQIQAEWADTEMYAKLKEGIQFHNPNVELQVKL